MYELITRWAVTISSIILVTGLYAQVRQIWKTKSAQDFNFLLVLALFIDSIAWLNYGLFLWEWPILVIGCISFPAVVGALVGYFKFGRKKNEEK